MDREIGQFLDKRISVMGQSGHGARDILVYFVGHGGFAGSDLDYYLATRRTRMENPIVSSIRIVTLAHTLKEKARYLRRILILDCCFAASTFKFFQASGPTQAALIQTIDAFKAQDTGIGFPGRGTSLLCSSRHNIPSLISPGGKYTMFSEALLCALRTGNARQQGYLPLRTVARLTEDFLREIPGGEAPRPEVHSPDQCEGDVADVPLFPNLARRAGETPQDKGILPREEELEDEERQPFKGPILRRRISRRVVIAGLTAGSLAVAGGGIALLEFFSRFLHPMGTTLFTYRGHSDHVLAVAWSPDGQQIASGSADETVQVWDAANGNHIYTYSGHLHSNFEHLVSAVNAVAWSPDSRRLASGDDYPDGTVQVWDAANGGHPYTYSGHSKVALNAVTTVAWSPDGKRIASGSEDNTVQVWDAANGGHPYTYSGHSEHVLAVAWSPDGRRIVSGSQDGTVQVWDAANGGHPYTYSGHSNYVLTVAWSPDGKRIASGSADRSVQVWDARDGSHDYAYRSHTDRVTAVTWSPDSMHIASGSDDKTVRVWQAT